MIKYTQKQIRKLDELGFVADECNNTIYRRKTCHGDYIIIQDDYVDISGRFTFAEMQEISKLLE